MSIKKSESHQAAGLSRLERLPSVKSRTGLSRSEIYRQVKVGAFPAPVKLSLRSSAWVSAEVDEWIDQRILLRFSSK